MYIVGGGEGSVRVEVFCSIYGVVLWKFLFSVAVLRFTKPSGLWYWKFSGNFNAVCGFLMLFCLVFMHNLYSFEVFVPPYVPSTSYNRGPLRLGVHTVCP